MDINYWIMRKILLACGLLLLALACASKSQLEGHYPPGGGQTTPEQPDNPPVPPAQKTTKILFIGNSLTLDATYLLPSLLNSAGVRNVELTRIFHGAYTLPLYNQNYANTGICSIATWKPGQARWRGEEVTSYAPKQAVEMAAYDIICLQEYTGQTCCWSWTEDERSVLESLLSKIRASQGENKPRFVFLFSTQFGRGMERLVNNFNDDPVKQFEANAGTIRHILEATGIETVISTGALQQNLRTTGLNSPRDMTRGDQTHLDYGLGRYAAALLVYKTLITPLTGLKAEDNPFTFDEYYPHPSLYTTPVTAENKPVVLAAVNAAFEHPLEITDLSSYATVPEYTHQPGTVLLSENVDIEPVKFPVVFPVGNGAVDAYKQPFWSGYGIWVCKDQPQAWAKWNFASYSIPNMVPTRNVAKNETVASPGLRGLWTGDWWEFFLPVKDFAAGTSVRFSAPFYTRQSPVFWTFEWLDGDTWKNDASSLTLDGFTRVASFALKAGSNSISRTASFSHGISEGYLRFRVRVADGTIQADSSTGKAVQRDLPNHTDSDYSSVFYFYGTGTDGQALRFDIVK